MMLPFFPWLTVTTELEYGDWKLLPYRRGVAPFGVGSNHQAHVDAVLEPFCMNANRPVERAALLGHARRQLFADLTDDEGREATVFAELLAFAGLANRQYFGLTYTNRDHYRLVVQPFTEDAHRVAILSRRRDGSSRNLFGAGAYREIRPHHVTSQSLAVDAALLSALLNAWDQAEWELLFEAIVAFGLANTDSPGIAPSTEAILTIGAFQRLLGCRAADEAELCTNFSEFLRPNRPTSVSDCRRSSEDAGVTARLQRARSIREGWIGDFYRLRGDLAHGRLGTRYPSIWDIHEHLLLAAFVFPILVKITLADRGFYELTLTDQSHLDAFEPLVCGNHLYPPQPGNHRDADDDEPVERVGVSWHRTLARAGIDRWVRQLGDGGADGGEAD